MRSFSKALAPLSIICLLGPGSSDAQVVQVAPGYVRAPFVRVYRTPDGGTHVRAPFVDVHSDGFRRVPPHAAPYDYPDAVPQPGTTGARYSVTPDMPTPMDVRDMDWRLLRRTVRSREADLETQLDRYRAASRWKSQLQIGALREILAVDTDLPPDPQSRDRLLQVLDAYNQAGLQPSLRVVTRLSSFQSARTALQELVTPPSARQRKMLAAAALDLEESLARLQNGSAWSDHLRLPSWIFSTSETGAQDEQEISELDADQYDELQRLARRFEVVAENPQYQAVTNLSAFQSTRQRLADFIGLFENPPAPGFEELPPPPIELD